jgi:hypothetical protein
VLPMSENAILRTRNISFVIWKDKGQKENWVGMGKKIGCEVGKSPTEGEMMSDDYVGLPEDEATVQAYNNGFDVVRIISRDGNYFPVTRDYREDRINFNIEETLVVQASIG